MINNNLNHIMERMEARSKEKPEAPPGKDPVALRIIEEMLKESDAEHPEKPPEKLPRSPEKRAEKHQLPLWPMATRGVPNAVLRSALFGVVRKGRRSHCYEIEIPSAGNLRVIYTGMRLDQADLDVWEQCLSLAKDNGLGTKIEFTANGFLKSIGRKTGKSQHEWLKQSLKRLNGAQVEIQEGDRAYFGTLIYDGFRDDESGRYIIQLNPKLSKLYGQHHWTRVQWDERHALKKDLSQWLHGFYSSHKDPHPIKTETIHWLCGSQTKDLRRFRQSLGVALKELQGVTGWKCWIDKEDKVNVVRHSK